MKKLLLVSLCLLATLCVTQVFVQNRTITGTVTAKEDGLPLPGVTVRIKGTDQGVSTDANGKFSISVQTGAILSFTYIAYISQDITVGASSVIDVVLAEDNQQLSEVVVTALGISRDKKSLGYATQQLNADEITRGQNIGLAGAIQGKVSGVEITPSSGMPGASARITIRGSRSLNATGNNSPLYVIDGLPISSDNDFNTGNSVTGSDYANRALDIDPNDIETLNILKGQAASALYGIRASNGAIVITTKSGKNAIGKPQVTINSNTTFDKISVYPELQSIYAQGTGGNYSPSQSKSYGPLINELPDNATYGGNKVNTFTNAAGLHPGMYYVPQRAAAGLDPWQTPQVYNNVKDFFQTGHTFSNSVNVAQGFEKGSFSITLGNANQRGIIPSTGLDRYTGKFAGEAKLSSHFTTGFNVNFANSKLTKQSSANNGVVATLYPAPPSYDLKGIPSNVANNPYSQNTYRSTSGFDGIYWAIKNNEFLERNQRFFGNAYLQFTSGLGTTNQKLTVKYQIGGDTYTTNYRDVFGYGHANGLGEVSLNDVTNNMVNSLFTASYNNRLSDDIVLDILVGNEFVHNDSRANYAFGQNFNYGGFNQMKNASVYSASEDYTQRRTIGNFANVSVDYKDMLFLNVTGRQDLISSMPSNNRSFFYPSASLGFVFTQLPALKNNNVLTFGKLRGSVAQVGQAASLFKQSFYSTPVFGGGFSSGTPILYPLPGGITAYTQDGVLYDPNLKPQNTTSYEIGTDLTFFNGVATLSYTYSRQNVTDQIFEVPLAASTGSTSLLTNAGRVHTNAHEVTLGFRPINRANVKWNINFNFTKIDNMVDALAPGVESLFLGGFTDPQVRASIGENFPTIYGVSYARNAAGEIVVDASGMPTAGPEKVIGRVSPKFILGVNTALEVKKVRLTAVLDWKNGGQMYAGTTGLLDFYGISQRSADLRATGTSFLFEKPAVKVTGTDGSGNPIYAPNDIMIPAAKTEAYFTRVNSISEGSIRDNSFVKLREVTLGYPVIDKTGLKVNLNVFARNLLIWSQIKGIDPESTQGNTNMSGAFERFSLPATSSYGLGLNVKF
ncbi:SusC/RagA family TonB-linked outer membrane protein [Mucilaginibacter puniceus]